jgi:hypothetical protein
MTTATVKKRGASRKAEGVSKAKRPRWTNRAADELTAERIRAILSDPKGPRRIKSKLEELTYQLYAETNAFSEPTPDSCAADFINGTVALCVTPDEDARAVYDEIVRLAERHEPEGYKVARRCTEIYDAAGGNGGVYFVEHVDAVLEGGEDGLMPNPDSKYFVPLFVEAFNARGARDHHVRKLLDLIKRVDGGADLNALYDEGERQEAARREALRAADLAKPEPKDRLSDEWRYWKIRHLDAGLQGGDAEAWGEFWKYLDAYKDAALSAEVYTVTAYTAARQMLPDLLIFWQKAQPKRKGKK